VIYLYAYLVVGFFITTGTWFYSRFTEKEGSASLEGSLAKKILSFFLVHTVAVPLWPILLYFFIEHLINRAYAQVEFTVKPEDLIEEWAIAAIEEKEMVFDPLSSVPHLPFGHLNQVWASFKNDYNSSTRLWSFESEYQKHSTTIIKNGYAKLEACGSINHVFICEEYDKSFEQDIKIITKINKNRLASLMAPID
jgi:hypothetical protein